jgi:hypothetical protein
MLRQYIRIVSPKHGANSAENKGKVEFPSPKDDLARAKLAVWTA